MANVWSSGRSRSFTSGRGHWTELVIEVRLKIRELGEERLRRVELAK